MGVVDLSYLQLILDRTEFVRMSSAFEVYAART
jgi:hypothetical protein